MAKLKDCLDCTKTAKQRRQQLDTIIRMAQEQANRDGVTRYVCKRKATGDFYVSLVKVVGALEEVKPL